MLGELLMLSLIISPARPDAPTLRRMPPPRCRGASARPRFSTGSSSCHHELCPLPPPSSRARSRYFARKRRRNDSLLPTAPTEHDGEREDFPSSHPSHRRLWGASRMFPLASSIAHLPSNEA